MVGGLEMMALVVMTDFFAVVKNPLSPVEHPNGLGVNNELFEESLEQFVVCNLFPLLRNVVNSLADTGFVLMPASEPNLPSTLQHRRAYSCAWLKAIIRHTLGQI